MGFIRYPDSEDVAKSVISVLQAYLPGALADIEAYRDAEDTDTFGSPIHLDPPQARNYYYGGSNLVAPPFIIVDVLKTAPRGNRAVEPFLPTPETHTLAIEAYLTDSLDQKVSLKITRFGSAIKRILQEHSRLEGPEGRWLVEAGWVSEAMYGRGASKKDGSLYRFVSIEATFETLATIKEF